MNGTVLNPDAPAFLLFKLRYIGDVLLTTPAIRLLKRSYPKCHITMVVNKGTEDVLRYNPHLDRILTVDRSTGLAGAWRLLRALRERRYDVSVDFASGDRVAWLSLLAGVPRRIALWSPEGVRRFLNNEQMRAPAVPFHIAEMYLSFVERGLAIKANDRSLELPVGGEDEKAAAALLRQHGVNDPFIALHVGGRSNAQYRWPRERWMEFAQAVGRTHRLTPVFVGGPDCLDDVNWIVSQPDLRAIPLVGQTTVLELAAVLKRASGFVGIASGPMHMAAAVGARVVALFVDDAAWRPWGQGHVILRVGRDSLQRPVEVTEVVEAVGNLPCKKIIS
ncbi:MAG: glycosyltransferase family 9 protein [Verrucomicrobia bacterium]|nr:glycosyltransferase family 9 protein [Verrucomicrobiota bacterium]